MAQTWTSQTMSTASQWVKFRLVITENSYNQTTNESNVTVKMQAWRTNQGYTTYGPGTSYIEFNGLQYTQAISNSQTITYNSYTVLFNRTFNIKHQDDGSLSVKFWGKFSLPGTTAEPVSWQHYTVTFASQPRYECVYVSNGTEWKKGKLYTRDDGQWIQPPLGTGKVYVSDGTEWKENIAKG